MNRKLKIKLKEQFRSLLNEKFINVWNEEDKRLYIDDAYELIQKAYQSIGGYPDTKEELIQDTLLWKMVRKGDKIVALRMYKDKNGRKAIAAATDGTQTGKEYLIQIISDDIKYDRSWSEVSGKMEHLLSKYGAIPVPNKYAAELTRKEILRLDPDGFHYDRMIGGEPHTKIIMTGIPDNLLNKLKKEEDE